MCLLSVAVNAHEDYPLVLRLLDVGGDGALDAAGLEGDGLRRLGVEIDVRRRDGEAVYMPVAIIDDELALRGHSVVLSQNLSMPAAAFPFRLVWAAPLTFMVRRGIRDHFRDLDARYPEFLVDKLRWQMRDEIVWRLVALLALKFGGQLRDIPLEIEKAFHGIAPAIHVKHGRKQMHPPYIRVSSLQARPDRIGRIILRAGEYHGTLRRYAAAIRPIYAGRGPGRDIGGNQRFPQTRITCQHRYFAGGNHVRPVPAQGQRLDIGQ